MVRIEKITKFEMGDGKCEVIDLTEHVREISFLSKEDDQLKQLDEKYKKVLEEIVNK